MKRHDWIVARTLPGVEVCRSCGLRRRWVSRIWEVWTFMSPAVRLTTRLPECPATVEAMAEFPLRGVGAEDL